MGNTQPLILQQSEDIIIDGLLPSSIQDFFLKNTNDDIIAHFHGSDFQVPVGSSSTSILNWALFESQLQTVFSTLNPQGVCNVVIILNPLQEYKGQVIINLQ